MIRIKIKYLSEPISLKVNLWRWADRVLLETVVPPVFGKESWLTGTYAAISRHLLSEVPFLYLNT